MIKQKPTPGEMQIQVCQIQISDPFKKNAELQYKNKSEHFKCHNCYTNNDLGIHFSSLQTSQNRAGWFHDTISAPKLPKTNL